ncbi:MAG: hypothetical protein IJR33_06375 [Clostridia bacterium]|nr:hypothetical protein [Clostridia bacterium]
MALFNNGYPATYPQYPIQPQIPTPQIPVASTNNPNNGIVWVQGEAGAKAYPVAPGNTVMMLDSENSVFYLKSTAANGVPQPLRVFDFQERTAAQITPQNINLDNYVTRKEFDELKAIIEPKKEAEENV